MSDRNEALRLAEACDNLLNHADNSEVVPQCAAALRRLTAEQAVMREWIAEALPVMDTICAESLEESNLLAALCESGRRLVDGGPDDLLAGVE